MPTAVFPPAPVVYVEAISQGIVASAGSQSKISEQVSVWRRTSTTGAFTKAAFDTAYQAAIVVPTYAALNARVTQQLNGNRVLNSALDQFVFFNHAVVGSIAGDSMSPSVSAYLLFRTGLRGKSYRGSKKLYPMSESDTTTGTDDVWNAGCLGRLATIAAAYLAGFTDANGNVWICQVFSRILSVTISDPTTLTSNDLQSTMVRKTAGSMRHRKAKAVY